MADETKGAVAPGQQQQPFVSLRREIDRLFDELGRPWRFGTSLWDTGSGRPMQEWVGSNWGAVDVSEGDKAYRVAIELPGCDEKDLDVSAVNGFVNVNAEKKQEKKEEKENYHFSERRYGTFQRSFRVPEGVEADKIDATFKNGVLELTLPKSESAQQQPKKITVNKN